jgi:hypothetical protein
VTGENRVMARFMICAVHRHYLGQHIKKTRKARPVRDTHDEL